MLHYQFGMLEYVILVTDGLTDTCQMRQVLAFTTLWAAENLSSMLSVNTKNTSIVSYENGFVIEYASGEALD